MNREPPLYRSEQLYRRTRLLHSAEGGIVHFNSCLVGTSLAICVSKNYVWQAEGGRHSSTIWLSTVIPVYLATFNTCYLCKNYASHVASFYQAHVYEQQTAHRWCECLYVGSSIPLVSIRIAPPIEPTPILFSYCIFIALTESWAAQIKTTLSWGVVPPCL